MERTVITFSVENIVTIFLMVAGVSAAIGLGMKFLKRGGANA